MAGYHTGALHRYNCQLCLNDPAGKGALDGCLWTGGRTELTQPCVLQDDEVNYILWNCPIHFVPNSIMEFYDEYKFYKDFPSARMPEFNEINHKFLEAYRYYEHCHGEFSSEVHKNNSQGKLIN